MWRIPYYRGWNQIFDHLHRLTSHHRRWGSYWLLGSIPLRIPIDLNIDLYLKRIRITFSFIFAFISWMSRLDDIQIFDCVLRTAIVHYSDHITCKSDMLF